MPKRGLGQTSPVWKAWIELACATDQTDQRPKCAATRPRAARHRVRGSNCGRGLTNTEATTGLLFSLERWLRIEPTATRAL